MLPSQAQPVLRRQPHPARRRRSTCRRASARRCSAATASARRRCCECLMGLLPIRSGDIRLRRQQHRVAAALRAREPRHRLRAAGPRHLSAAHRAARTCEMGLATQKRGAGVPELHLRDVSGAEGHAGPPRRRSFRRPAAAARDRPRAHAAAEAPDPRRADRGHPAVDHQGHRARDPQAHAAAARWRSCWSSSTTISRSRSPTTTS